MTTSRKRSWIESSDVLSLFPIHDPRSQAGVIRPPVTELTSANTDQVVVRVRSGTLLVFPSYLQHSVDANAGSESRVSVSFNLMFSAFTAELSKPLWGDK